MVENFLKLGGSGLALLRRQKGFTTDKNGIERVVGEEPPVGCPSS